MTGGPVGRELDATIEAVIKASPFPADILNASQDDAARLPLAIKYIPAKYASCYLTPSRLKISETPGFTWGRGTYITPLAYPLSTAIFGRVGVICEFDPGRWRMFDATSAVNRQLYLAWLQSQPLYPRFAMSAQSAYLSQLLRDQFRRRYRIDCVLFRPDQSNPQYTKAASDVWMNVTDWTSSGTIAVGFSSRLPEARITVVLEEEFEDAMGGIHRSGLLNLTKSRAPGNLTARLALAYRSGEIVRISS